ncbi:MAG: hypothetical protein H8E15_03195 [Planctomycetes bacterium]|nr:hypothetical protein [Planctomycetota bacterium]
MTRNTLLTLLSLLLMTALSAPLISGFAQEPGDRTVGEKAQEPGGPDEHDETVLAKNMETVKKGMRRLRRGLKDQEQLPAALPLILSMQEAAHLCKVEIPAMTAGVEGEEAKATFVKEYRLGMIKLQGQLLDLETAVLNGDVAAAQKIFGGLKDAQEAGHEKFTEE